MNSAAPPSAHAGAAPADQRSAGFLLVFALANAGGVIAYLPLLTLLLPMKVQALAGATRLDVLTACVLAGGVGASLSNIAFGWLSDRTLRPRLGRRPWIAAGLLATAVSYAGVAAADTAWQIILSILCFQIAVNALLAPLLALMADEVPDAQKGVAGGLLALGNPLAAAFAALLVTGFALGEAARWAAIPAAVLACVLPLILSRARPAAPAPRAAERPMLRRDLLVAWTARLLVQVAGSVVSLYLLYYLESVAPGTPSDQAATSVSRLLILAYALPLPIAVLAGRFSDRIERRKPVLLVAALASAAGLVAMGLARDWTAATLGFVAFAVGSAVFLALHAAFAMQLLPDPRHRGRDLGLLNLTNTLPALLGPVLTWALATPHDFAPLMFALAALTAGGGIVILAAQGRR